MTGQSINAQELTKIIGKHLALRIDDECIGEGTYGKVFSATHQSTGERHALKVSSTCVPGISEYSLVWNIENEMRLVGSLKHPNIINAQRFFECKPKRLFVFMMPLAEGGDLESFVVEHKAPIPHEQLTDFTRQLLNGLVYLHGKGFAHRDLKPENVLLDGSHKRLMISDFGTSAPVDMDRDCDMCSIYGRPVEYMLECESHDPTLVDVWSLGCIVYFLLFRKYMFLCNDYSEIGTMFSIFRHLGTPTEATWPGVSLAPLYQACFPKFPHKRIEDSCDFTGHPRHVTDVIVGSLRLYPFHRLPAEELLRNFTLGHDLALAHDLAQAAESTLERNVRRCV